MKNNRYIAAFAIIYLFVFAPFAAAQLDDGTGADGVPIFCSRTLAMHCDIGSSDGGDSEKIKACFDKLAAGTHGSQTFKKDIDIIKAKVLRECSNTYYQLAIKTKVNAGDYVERGDAEGYSELETTEHGKKTQETKMTAGNAKNILLLSQLYSSSMALDAIETFFYNIANREIPDELKEGEE